jgi:hypothetical protein
MTQRFRLVLVLWTVCLLPAGVGQATSDLEQAVETYITYIDELGQILATVHDEASAIAVKPQLQALMAKLLAVVKQFKNISPATREQLEQQYAARMGETAKRLQKQVVRVMSNPQIGAHIQEALPTLPDLSEERR